VTNGEGNDVGPAWSPNGMELAFLRTIADRGQVIVVPAAGGAERKVVEFDAPSTESDDAEISPSVAWSRDGRTLVVSAPQGDNGIPALATVPASGGALQVITKPPENSQGDLDPVVSPDGKSIAFVRQMEKERADIYLCDWKGGGVRQLTFDNHDIRGLAWTAGGEDLMYASNRGSGYRLWRVQAYGGSPRDLIIGGNRASFPAIAPAGNRLVFVESPAVAEIWMAQIGANGEPEREHPVIRSAGRETNPSFSPDGKRIADISAQSGDQEVWITDADGTRTQLTRLENRWMDEPRWSPDGKMLLVTAHGPNGSEIFTVPAAGGKSTRVLSDASDGAWSHDGKSIYYSSWRGGGIWKADADGTNARQIVRRGGGNPRESVDGKYIYYQNRRALWRAPSDGGEGEEVFVPEHDLGWGGGLQPTAKGIFYLEFARGGRSVMIAFYDFATAKSQPVVRFKNTRFDGFSISPDGRTVLFSKVDRNETNLQMVENFR